MKKSSKPQLRKIKKLLIANRGEIAVRIIRTCRELGLKTVALFSDVDAQSMHVKMADQAYHLAGSSVEETYLNESLILKALREAEADALHPGYGFLSEKADFARAVSAQGVLFIGPPAASMQLMGDKLRARKLMAENKIPILPGCGAIKNLQELKVLAKKISYPLILKAAAGGGGRGLRIVREEAELEASLHACQREAKSYFADATVFCEKLLEKPRHIEVQILCDQYGSGVHLGERDCSLQRKQQKIFEEAPAWGIDEEQREYLGSLSLEVAKLSAYSGVGTVEFLLDQNKQVYFLEMNTRIQVEHPVTEMISGIDLIAEQIKVSCGEKLSYKQEDISLRGWSMEARINAEKISTEIYPSSGTVSHVKLASGPFVRCDTHIYSSYSVPSDYDSLLVKLIVWGQNREQARSRMLRALKELELEGIDTNQSLHQAVLLHPQFKTAQFHTQFLEENWQELIEPLELKCFSSLDLEKDKTEMALLAGITWQTEHVVSKIASDHENRVNWSRQSRLEASQKGAL